MSNEVDLKTGRILIPIKWEQRVEIWCPLARLESGAGTGGGHNRTADGSARGYCLGPKCAFWIGVNKTHGKCGAS